MVLRRFIYDNGLDIIAPLKCGTRFLENETKWKETVELSSYEIPRAKITNDTYFVWRDGMEWLISALKTEIRGELEFNETPDIDRILNEYQNGIGTHWSNTIYKDLHKIWNRREFKLIELKELSNLFPDSEFERDNYKMLWYHKTSYDTDEIMKWIPKDIFDKLCEDVEKDREWLDLLLKREHIPLTFI